MTVIQHGPAVFISSVPRDEWINGLLENNDRLAMALIKIRERVKQGSYVNMKTDIIAIIEESINGKQA